MGERFRIDRMTNEPEKQPGNEAMRAIGISDSDWQTISDFVGQFVENTESLGEDHGVALANFELLAKLVGKKIPNEGTVRQLIDNVVQRTRNKSGWAHIHILTAQVLAGNKEAVKDEDLQMVLERYNDRALTADAKIEVTTLLKALGHHRRLPKKFLQQELASELKNMPGKFNTLHFKGALTQLSDIRLQGEYVELEDHVHSLIDQGLQDQLHERRYLNFAEYAVKVAILRANEVNLDEDGKLHLSFGYDESGSSESAVPQARKF